jgi:hypothetical protein
MTKTLGFKFKVFDIPMNEELVEKIEAHLLIKEQGVNWGIRHVKAALARLDIKAPRWNISRALQVLSGAHYEQ